MEVSFASVAAPGGPNEDHVIAAGAFAVVLDGVTAPPGLDTGCVHGTRWLVHTLGELLAAQLAQRPDAPLARILADAIHQLRERHGGRCDLAHPEGPATTVAIVRELADTVEYLVLCDTDVVFDGPDGCWAVTDDRTARLPAYDRATVARLRNTPQGFWVASTSPAAADHARTGRVPRDGLRQVVICTDGGSRLVHRFGWSWHELLALVDRSGPHGVIDTVRAAEQRATGVERRGKVFDDATVVVCRLGAGPGRR